MVRFFWKLSYSQSSMVPLSLLLILEIINYKTQSWIAPDGNNNDKYASVLQSLTDMRYSIIEGNMTFLQNSTEFGENPDSVYGALVI